MTAIAARDLLRALGALDAIAREAVGLRSFARAGVRVLPGLVGSDLTILSCCDLQAGRRRIEGVPPGALDRRACEAFERHLPSHPLIDAYRRDPRPRTCRLSDAIGLRAFLGSPLYAEYYRPLGVRHAIVVPVHADRRHVVAFALHRDGPPFRDAERALLECVRPQLGALHRLAAVADARGLGPAGRSAAPRPGPGGLTRREREVVGWVGAGKTNRDIAAILGTSPRTVEKHLEHVYVKLGVETRTAAVLRALPARRPG